MFNRHHSQGEIFPHRDSRTDDILRYVVTREPDWDHVRTTIEIEAEVDLLQRMYPSDLRYKNLDKLQIGGYLELILPYGPPIIKPLLLVAAIRAPRYGNEAQSLAWIIGHVINRYSPYACRVVEDLFNLKEFDMELKKRLHRLEPEVSRDVLSRDYLLEIKASLIHTLCMLAWPEIEEWPDRKEEVKQWANQYLFDDLPKMGLVYYADYALGVCLNKLEAAKREMRMYGTCLRIISRDLQSQF